MERQRSAVDRLKDLKRQLAQARDSHIADATSEPAILYPRGPAKAKRSPDEQRRREQEVPDGNRRDLINRRVFRLVWGVLNDLPGTPPVHPPPVT